MSGTTSDNFADNAFLFGDTAAKSQVDPAPKALPGDTSAVGTSARPGSPMGRSNTTPEGVPPQTTPVAYRHASYIMIQNDGDGVGLTGRDLIYTFNETEDAGSGVGVHGVVRGGETVVFRKRYEAGIAVKSANAGVPTNHRITAW